MKRFLAFLCALALTLSLVPGAAFAATQDLQAEIDAGAEKIVLEADASDITVTRDTTIDLNGHNIDGVSVLAGTLYLMDSQTADYTVADGVYGHVTGVTGAVKAAEGYLQVGDSFHAVNLDIYAMSLRATDVGVYYKSHFAADEIVAAQVESFGVALSVVTAPNASNLETYCGYSDFTGFEAGEGANSVGTSTLLKGIMKATNGDEKNAKNAAMPVYGRAYIKTADGYFFGETVKRSLQEQVEAIDKVWNKLTDAQKTPVLAMLEGYTSVMENWNIPNIRGIQVPGTDADIEIPIEVTAENGVVTEAVTVEANGVCVTVPAGTKLAANATGLTVLVTEKETSDAGLTLEESEVLMPMDVHVEGLAADNTAPLTIYLGKVMAENLNMGNYAVYHVENGKANEMVLIPVDAEFTAHNQYKYSLDGELTLYMATFSEVAIRSKTTNTWNGNLDYSWYNTTDEVLYIRNADQLAGFGAIVGGMANEVTKAEDGTTTVTTIVDQDSFAGKTVVLWADIDLGDDEENNVEGKIFYPIGYWNSDGVYEKTGTAISSGFYAFAGTFDGNGNTISNFYQNTWEMKGDHDWYDANLQYYRDGMGLFGKVYGGTVRNLIVDNFSCDSEIGTSGVIAAYADSKNGQPAIFENITITNCNPRVYNIGNGGIVGCAGWYSRNEDLKLTVDDDEYANAVTFRNITVDQTNKISALWGSWGVSCAGILGQYYPNSACGIKLENCHVAAIIDVNNDVCSNYQYYWYRYAGMFIGTIRANTKDANGYEIADTTGVTATDCTYTMGNWNEYWYCEIVANSIASYTHDHQFSRLDNITDISEIQNTDGTWKKEGHFALLSADRKSVECYHIFKDSNGELYQHFHNVADESNPNIYEDFDLDGNGKLDDLKEDRQRYFIPFNQLLTGLDMGIKAHTEFEGIRFVENGTIKSESKFESIVDKDATYKAGQTIYLDELVKAIVDESKIAKATLYAAVSPANEDTTTKASATYALDAGDWKNSSITLGEDCVGAIKIVITDYYFCTPTTITVTVKPVAKIGEIEYASLQNALDAAQDGDTIVLLDNVAVSKYLDVYTANLGETERAITLDLDGHTIAPAADYKYEWYPLVFVGINQTLNIKNGTIASDEHTAIGVYGSLNLENVNVTVTGEKEDAVCIWNWGEDDDYYKDCPYKLTGSATITGTSSISGGILVEGPVVLGENIEFDKLYLNTKTGRGKLDLPTGYGLVKENDYYTNLHEHTYGNDGACTTCGLAFSYVKTDLAYIDSTDIVVITMTKNGTTWALTSEQGTSKTPNVVEVEVQGNVITTNDITGYLQWNINSIAGNLVIYPNGDNTKYLYCTDENDGIRVGHHGDSDQYKEFVIKDNYLYNIGRGRYVGVYLGQNNENAQDWRCYTTINSNIQNQTLAFYVLKSNCAHNGNIESRGAVAATCTVAGREAGLYCLDCDTYVENGRVINATGHNFESTSAIEATCEEDGKNIYHCSVCNKVKIEKIPAAHTWVDGVCSACGAEQTFKTYIFSGYTAGEQYAQNEEHELDDMVTVTTTQCHFTSELRIYSSAAHNGHAIIESQASIEKIEFTAGYEADKLNIYGSVDGENWELISSVAVTSAYSNHMVELDSSYPWIKLDVDGDKQVRLKSMTLYFAPACAHENTEVIGEAKDATCDEAGITAGTKCIDCGRVLVKQETIPETGHSYESKVTTAPGCETTGVKTYTCANCDDSYTEVIAATGHSYDENDVCTSCGKENPDAAEEYTITFMVGNQEFKTLTQEMNTTIDLETIEATEIEGYTFVGWTDSEIEQSENASRLPSYKVVANDTLYALYSYEEAGGESGYKLVTNVAMLKNDQHVVIAASSADYALSTEQKENNRGVAAVTKSGDTITFGEDVQILTLKEGATSGTYAFYTGEGYLYAASSTANQLKTQKTNNKNGIWTITVDSNGVASIVAQDSSNRNIMRYNPNKGGSPLFACYAASSTTGESLSIYAETSAQNTYFTTNVCTHANTTETVVDVTCTEAGSITETCNDCGKVISENVLVALGHSYDEGEVTTPATCTTTGVKTYTCTRDNCGETKTETIDALGHNYVDGTCSQCGAEDPDAEEPAGTKTVTFTLGDDGNASHNEGTKQSSYSKTVDGYTLSITNGTSMYTSARDAKGNSCIKLGSGSSKGSFSFTVAENVTSVVIYIAKYKTNASKVSVNGTTYTLSNNSNDGKYDVITVDTTTTKTVTVTTVSGYQRAMVNTIEFVVPKN